MHYSFTPVALAAVLMITVAGCSTTRRAIDEGTAILDPDSEDQPVAAQGSGRQLPAEVFGTYEGSFKCSHGRTGVRLDVTPGSSPMRARARVKFFPTEESPEIPTGSYKLDAVQGERSGLVLEPLEWIERPAGYQMVGFEVDRIGPTYEVLVGQVDAPGCGALTLRQVAEAELAERGGETSAESSSRWATGWEPWKDMGGVTFGPGDTISLGDFQQLTHGFAAADIQARTERFCRAERKQGIGSWGGADVGWALKAQREEWEYLRPGDVYDSIHTRQQQIAAERGLRYGRYTIRHEITSRQWSGGMLRFRFDVPSPGNEELWLHVPGALFVDDMGAFHDQARHTGDSSRRSYLNFYAAKNNSLQGEAQLPMTAEAARAADINSPGAELDLFLEWNVRPADNDSPGMPPTFCWQNFSGTRDDGMKPAVVVAPEQAMLLLDGRVIWRSGEAAVH